MAPKKTSIGLADGQQNALAHTLTSPSDTTSHLSVPPRTNSKGKTTNSSTPTRKKTRRDSMFTSTSSLRADDTKQSKAATECNSVHFMIVEGQNIDTTPPSHRNHTDNLASVADTADFDDLCLGLARSPAILQALHTSSTANRAQSVTSVRNILRSIGPVYRSLCLSDPKLTGHPIRFRSTHFSLSPRGLRVGDCDFLNLPHVQEVNLTTRAGVDGRPMFVLELVTGMHDVEHGGIVWIGASQVDVTEVVRNMAMAVVRGRERKLMLREEVETEDEKRLKRVKENHLVFPDAIASLDDSKYYSDSDDQDEQVLNKAVVPAKAESITLLYETPSRKSQSKQQRNASTRSTSTSVADTKYFSSSSDSDFDDLDEEHFFTSPSSSPSPMRNSLTSHPNTPFLYHSPSHTTKLNTAYAETNHTRQVHDTTSPVTSSPVPLAKIDGEDIWRTLSHTYAHPDFYSRPAQPTFKPLSNHTVANHPNDTIPLPSLLSFHQLITTLRALHRDSFVLKATGPSMRDGNIGYEITHVSASLLRSPKDIDVAFGASHEQTKRMMEAGLKRGGEVKMREVKMRVRWGFAGVERWAYFVPLVQGVKGQEGGKRCWMCFLVDSENGGDMWTR